MVKQIRTRADAIFLLHGLKYSTDPSEASISFEDDGISIRGGGRTQIQYRSGKWMVLSYGANFEDQTPEEWGQKEIIGFVWRHRKAINAQLKLDFERMQ